MGLVVVVKCQNFRCSETQKIEVGPNTTREQVETFAGILDGRSPLYILSPRQETHSLIGRCVRCGDNFNATVEDA